MALITTADVTYAYPDTGAPTGPSIPQVTRNVTITFGNGSLTYPGGGIPLSAAKLGCPASLSSFLMSDAANSTGYVPKLDMTNLKIRLYQNDTAATLGPLIEVATTAAVLATVLKVSVSGY